MLSNFKVLEKVLHSVQKAEVKAEVATESQERKMQQQGLEAIQNFKAHEHEMQTTITDLVKTNSICKNELEKCEAKCTPGVLSKDQETEMVTKNKDMQDELAELRQHSTDKSGYIKDLEAKNA